MGAKLKEVRCFPIRKKQSINLDLFNGRACQRSPLLKINTHISSFDLIMFPHERHKLHYSSSQLIACIFVSQKQHL